MMSIRKYQSVEKTEILPPQEQKKITTNLKGMGKTSARDLSDAERKIVLDS